MKPGKAPIAAAAAPGLWAYGRGVKRGDVQLTFATR